MPQMAIIQPAPPKGPPQTKKAGTTGDRDLDPFSPHLDKAVSRKKQPQADDSRANAPVKKNTEIPAEPNDQIQQSTEPEKTSDILTEPEKTPTVADTADSTGLTTVLNEKNVQLAQFTQQIKPAAQQSQNALDGDTEDVILPEAKAWSVELKSPGLAVAAESDHKTPAVKAQNTLLDQLQRIIDQSDETGIVAITKAQDGNPGSAITSMRGNMHGVLVPTPPENSAQLAVAQPVETEASPASILLAGAADGAGKAPTRASQQVPPDSHDSRQHSFNPKIATAEQGNARQNFQDSPQGDGLQQQTPGSGAHNGFLTGLSNSPELGNTFSQILTTPQQPTNQTADTADRPVMLPSGIIVQEDDIIQQLRHRMQISGKNMDTRINLKLHPAELGSLKIDLTVKEGSIRANVIAQSQHTSELLEKNMAKLKTVLENQGYSVDEISITAESESVSDFNLFDRQMFGHDDYTPQTPKAGKKAEAVFTLPDTLFATPTINTGVNVKI